MPDPTRPDMDAWFESTLASYLAERGLTREEFRRDLREEHFMNPMAGGPILTELTRDEMHRYRQAAPGGGTLAGFQAHLRACAEANPDRWFMALAEEWIQREDGGQGLGR